MPERDAAPEWSPRPLPSAPSARSSGRLVGEEVRVLPGGHADAAGMVPTAAEAATVYAEAGGDATFRRLVDVFYARIAADPILRPLFPASLEEGKERQFLFLTQFFGGPARYAERRGHPRLRARHLPFAIGSREAEAWLGHMLAAIDAVGIPEPARTRMRGYFSYTAMFLRNREDPPT